MRTPLLLLCLCLSLHLSSAAERPNILLIVADDLGFSDLGCYGGEIETPNLDRLAANGLRFTQFYNTGRCWPTRSALLSGYYPQQIRRDALPTFTGQEQPKGLGGQGTRPPWAQLISTHLSNNGYRCYHQGKWHIDGLPTQNGFHHSYHIKDQGRFFNPKILFEDDQELPPIQPNSGFYATTALVDKTLQHLTSHQQNHPNKPFFNYLAFAAPHFPLHALPEDIAKYRDRYLNGWDQLRSERHQRQKEIGILPDSTLSPLEPDIGPPYPFPDAIAQLGPGEINRPLPWHQLTPEQQRFQATKMAIHAAMIDRMDREIGRLLSHLEHTQQLHNTLIFFLSDNGASAEIMVRDDGHDPTAPMGSATSYLCLGPGFSSAANTPFRRHKTWTHEGGTATPLIAHWPATIQHPGSIHHAIGHVIDLFPTLLSLTHTPPPTLPTEAPPLPGLNLTPTLTQPDFTPRRRLWFFPENNRAFLDDHWKIVADNQTESWALYNLKTDRTELHNLATSNPGLVEEMETKWKTMATAFLHTIQQMPPMPEPKAKGQGKGKASAKR